MVHLSWLLIYLEAIVGMKINTQKSELIPTERVTNVEDLDFELGCKVGKVLTTLLELPLGSVRVWNLLLLMLCSVCFVYFGLLIPLVTILASLLFVLVLQVTGHQKISLLIFVCHMWACSGL